MLIRKLVKFYRAIATGNTCKIARAHSPHVVRPGIRHGHSDSNTYLCPAYSMQSLVLMIFIWRYRGLLVFYHVCSRLGMPLHNLNRRIVLWSLLCLSYQLWQDFITGCSKPQNASHYFLQRESVRVTTSLQRFVCTASSTQENICSESYL